jgi:hypothetical protein
LKNLLKHSEWNLEELAEAIMAKIELQEWLYLMPIKVD